MRDLSRQSLASIRILIVMPPILPALELAQAKPDKAKSKSEGESHPEDRGPGEFTLDFVIDFSTKEARRRAAENNPVGQKPLPPGIHENLARGKPLSPGIAKRSLPASLVKQLPAHAEFEWQMAGTALVLICKADEVVREIAGDVFKERDLFARLEPNLGE